MIGVPCYVGLGSNLGDRLKNIRRALDCLDATPGLRVERVSEIWETDPWGVLDQPRFLNGVALLDAQLGPIQLLIRLKHVEKLLGRRGFVRWGPRLIDLDVLLYGDLRLDRRGLTIPHARMHERRFVLEPLRELCPEYVSPDGVPIDELLRALDASESKPQP